jgi:hypothetical protein
LPIKIWAKIFATRKNNDAKWRQTDLPKFYNLRDFLINGQKYGKSNLNLVYINL